MVSISSGTAAQRVDLTREQPGWVEVPLSVLDGAGGTLPLRVEAVERPGQVAIDQVRLRAAAQPAAVVPEAPLAVLLPLVGLGVALVVRRRLAVGG